MKILRHLYDFGASVLNWVRCMLQTLGFFIQILASCFGKPFYYEQLRLQCVKMLIGSLPITALTAFFTGSVLALQSYTAFARLMASSALPEIVAVSFTRELGPVLCALMMSGYWAASMAAELATMRVTDQWDALITLSTNPMRYLVLPKVLSAILILPFLTLIADIIGIMGGYVVGVWHYHIPSGHYLSKTVHFLSFQDIYSGICKALVFGFIIAFFGCYEGYRARGGAQGVGSATTRGVVNACIGILLLNYFMTAYFFTL